MVKTYISNKKDDKNVKFMKKITYNRLKTLFDESLLLFSDDDTTILKTYNQLKVITERCLYNMHELMEKEVEKNAKIL